MGVSDCQTESQVEVQAVENVSKSSGPAAN